MASTAHMSTATIYQFPTRARVESSAASRADRASVAHLHGAPLARTEFGSGWYHEAAMREEDEQSWKNEGH